MEDVRPVRLLVKTMLLFMAVNFGFSFINPPIGKLTLYNNLFPGRLRFPYEQEPEFYYSGYNAPVYDDFDAMFGAHVVAQRKAANEYRVFLLGDSSTWGVAVQPGDMLSEQINKHAIKACDGRDIRVYNLGYPMSSLARDLLIMDKAMEYQPDLILWLVTLSTFEPKTSEYYFIQPHAERYLRLANAYHLSAPEYAVPIHAPSILDGTIVNQRTRLKRIAFNQAMGVLWSATGIDNHEGLHANTESPSPDVENDPTYEGQPPHESSAIFNTLKWEVVLAGYARAGDIPVVLVNEPIFVATGLHSDVRYNSLYPRWIFDEYRQYIFEWMTKQKQSYLDFWDAIPSTGFADQAFHRNPMGEKRFADLLIPALQRLTCPN